MKPTEELAGRQLLVSMDLEDDPLNRQGTRGILAYLDLEKDDVYVSFGKDTGLYPSEGLLTFRNPNDIYRDMMGNSRNLLTSDLKDLYRIGMLLDSKSAKDEQTAMDIAIANPSIRSVALEPLKDKLALLPDRGQEQQTEMSFGRGR